MFSLSIKNFIVKSDDFPLNTPQAADLPRTFANAPRGLPPTECSVGEPTGWNRGSKNGPRLKGGSKAAKGGAQGGRPKVHLDF